MRSFLHTFHYLGRSWISFITEVPALSREDLLQERQMEEGGGEHVISIKLMGTPVPWGLADWMLGSRWRSMVSLLKMLIGHAKVLKIKREDLFAAAPPVGFPQQARWDQDQPSSTAPAHCRR